MNCEVVMEFHWDIHGRKCLIFSCVSCTVTSSPQRNSATSYKARANDKILTSHIIQLILNSEMVYKHMYLYTKLQCT